MHCMRCKAPIERTYRACPQCGEPVTEFARRYTDELLDGKYRVIERLGAGGMGEVYRAEHTFLGSTRVIKVIRAQISDNRDAHDRFLREARAATKVQHQNVATLHDFAALPDGSHYMVWEYIDGENLAQRIRARGILPPRTAARIAIQALHGLDAIHRAGIIHRDISPENLMITRDDEVKIIDLGVAKVEDPSEVAATKTGIFIGKLRYASPEHLGFLNEGEKLDGRADLYSLAMVLYEMLTGRPPFEATSPHEYYMLHARQEHKPLDLPMNLPGGAALQAVLQKALARERTQRYATAREFAHALEEVERTMPDQASMRTVAVPLDGDETMRVTPAPAAQTVRTAVKPTPAPATVRTPMPMPPPSSSKLPFIVVAAAVVFILAGAMWFLRPGEERPPLIATNATPSTTTTTTASQDPAQPAAASVIVEESLPATATTAPTTTVPTLSTTTAREETPLTPSPSPRPRGEGGRRPGEGSVAEQPAPPPPVVTRTTEPEPAPAPRLVESANVDTYREQGDEDANDAAVTRARQHLAGMTQVSIEAGPLWTQRLTNVLKEESFTVVEGADVVIRFEGNLERLGRGRKARSARATVYKNGRAVFRYEMPREEYRVGADPAEAFAGVLADAVH